MKVKFGPGPGAIFLLCILAACSPRSAPETPAIYLPGTAAAPSASPSPAPPEETAAPGSGSTPTGSNQAGCGLDAGSIQIYEIPWQDETLQGRIYTPPCYDQELDRNYPVLYLLHGATESDQQWDDLGIDELADTLISQGKIPPLLIVMPREKTWVALRENPFGDQIVQGLLPWVESRYRTLESRQYRAVGGLSRGGNWAIRLGLVHWGLFGSLGGHSTPLFYGDLTRVPGWLEAVPEGTMPRIYLDISEGDKNLEEALAFRDLLLRTGVDLDWHLNPGLHDENYWESHLEEYLLWYSAGWDAR